MQRLTGLSARKAGKEKKRGERKRQRERVEREKKKKKNREKKATKLDPSAHLTKASEHPHQTTTARTTEVKTKE